MARPVSEEELQLRKRARRRLIGAIVVVIVVAVVLPMVLDSEPRRTSQDVSIQIPAPDSKGFVSKVVPLSPPGKDGKTGAKSKPAPASDPQAASPAETPAAKADVPAAKPEPAKTEAPKAEPPKPAPKAPAKTEGGYFVQVVALADTEKARQVQQQIVDAGLKSYTEVVAAGKGNVTRVRAGPFATREEAEAAQKKLQAAGLEGKVGSRNP